MKRIISLCCILAALILMSLPFSVQMEFISDPGPPIELVTSHFSYISILPLKDAETIPQGFTNWMPLITAVLSLAILIMLVFGIKKDRGMVKDNKVPICICLITCIAATFVSWSIFSTLTIIGATVFALHFALLAVQVLHFESKEKVSRKTSF